MTEETRRDFLQHILSAGAAAATGDLVPLETARAQPAETLPAWPKATIIPIGGGGTLRDGEAITLGELRIIQSDTDYARDITEDMLDPSGIWREVLKRMARRKPNIEVITCASASNPDENGEEDDIVLNRLGAGKVTYTKLGAAPPRPKRPPSDASKDSPEYKRWKAEAERWWKELVEARKEAYQASGLAKRLGDRNSDDKIDIVLLEGGDQSLLVDVLKASGLDQVLKKRAYEDPDFILMGNSAGAMALSPRMIIGKTDPPALVPPMAEGLGILPFIIDTHFYENEYDAKVKPRLPRLLAATKELPGTIGIGLNRHSGMVIQGNHAEVFGSKEKSATLVFDQNAPLEIASEKKKESHTFEGCEQIAGLWVCPYNHQQQFPLQKFVRTAEKHPAQKAIPATAR